MASRLRPRLYPRLRLLARPTPVPSLPRPSLSPPGFPASPAPPQPLQASPRLYRLLPGALRLLGYSRKDKTGVGSGRFCRLGWMEQSPPWLALSAGKLAKEAADPPTTASLSIPKPQTPRLARGSQRRPQGEWGVGGREKDCCVKKITIKKE